MIDITMLVMIIAKHVRKQLGSKSLNELIEAGIAVYAEVSKAMPQSRAIQPGPQADPAIVQAVLEELQLEE